MRFHVIRGTTIIRDHRTVSLLSITFPVYNFSSFVEASSLQVCFKAVNFLISFRDLLAELKD